MYQTDNGSVADAHGHGGGRLDELELSDYLDVLRRRWPIVVIATFACAAIATVLAVRQPAIYQAEAEILLDLDRSSQLIEDQGGQSAFRILENEERVLNSRLILDDLEQQAGEGINASARNNDDTDTLVLTVTGLDPDGVADAANLYAELYLELRRTRATSELGDIVDSLDGFIAEIDQQIRGLRDGNPNDQAELTRLRELRQTFDDERSTLLLSVDVNRRTNDLVITPATVPVSPIAPQPMRNAVLAGVVGLVLGVGMAMLVDYLDDTIKSKDDLERAVGRLPTLALVPRDAEADHDPLEHGRGDSAIAEAYRNLRTSVQFLAAQNDVRSIQITSAEPGEGKTTTSVNLAIAMAQAGKEVIIVGADLRNPGLHRQLPIHNERGLSTVLVGLDELAAAVQAIDRTPGLYVLPAGPTPPNPAELLSDVPAGGLCTTLGEIVRILADDGFFVIVDSAPVLPVTDALPTSRATDATLLVASDKETHAKALGRTIEALGLLRTSVIGTVYNKVQGRRGIAGYRYRYGYTYGSTTPAAGPWWSRWRRGVDDTAAADAVLDLSSKAAANGHAPKPPAPVANGAEVPANGLGSRRPPVRQ